MTSPTGVRIGAHVDQTDPIAEAKARQAPLVQFFLGDPQGYKGPEIRYAGGAAGLRLGDRVGLVDVGADPQVGRGLAGHGAQGRSGGPHRRFRSRPRALVGCPVRSTGRRALRAPSARTDASALLPRNVRGRLSPKEVETALRAYEVMVILDPSLDERTVAPSLDTYLNLVRSDGGQVDNVEVWGRRRLAYEIDKHSEGIYAVVDLKAEPATVKELDRQLTLN